MKNEYLMVIRWSMYKCCVYSDYWDRTEDIQLLKQIFNQLRYRQLTLFVAILFTSAENTKNRQFKT